jgi:uncharacterized protein YprB with RNaseH-like and TPR domain
MIQVPLTKLLFFDIETVGLYKDYNGLKSPKEGEVTGNRVHEAYYDFNQLDLIVEYCERDVMVLIDIIKKLKELQ